MTHAVVKPGFERRDPRGRMIEVVNRGPWHSILSGEMTAGAVMGQHYHKRTRILFFIARGRAAIDTLHVETGVRDRIDLHAGEGIVLEPMETHAIRFLDPSEFLMLKSEPFNPKDDDTFAYPIPE